MVSPHGVHFLKGGMTFGMTFERGDDIWDDI
jgi:hypothetical protein